jgi:hypothetical protein
LTVARQNLTLFSSALIPGSRCISLRRYKYTNDFVQLLELLGEYVELQDPFEDILDTEVERGFFSENGGEALAWILRASYADYQHRSMEECGRLILKIVASSYRSDMPGLVRTILKERRPDEHMCSVKDNEHNTLLHRAIGYLGVIFSEENKFIITDQPEIVKELRSLITDFVKAGSDLRARSH